jgi:predicted GTPase
MKNVIILGAAGRDFHDFMVYWSLQPDVVVKCFTETQIPGIEYRTFPAEMCHNDKNGNKYPEGLKINPEAQLEDLIKLHDVDTCALAYSDLSYDTVQALAARVTAAGAAFVQLPPKLTMLPSSKPVIAICATRTGTGKSQTTRFVAKYLKEKGKKVAVVRHPMPYDRVLLDQRCQRYETLEDLVKYKCTIEEREEYELHIEEGNLLFAGVDYEMILREAEKAADIVIWDGGNNDFSFFKPDLQVTVADALRANHGQHYFPGEVNIKLADVILINKVNSLPREGMAHDQAVVLKELVDDSVNILFGNSIVTPDAIDAKTGEHLSEEEATKMIAGKRVLVVDDGPTLTHGGMPFGAGFVLAEKLGAAEVIDPRVHAKGSLVDMFRKFTHLEKVLPAMGYGEDQVHDLENTILDAEKDIDCVITGTPIDLSRVIKMSKPCVRARYRLELMPPHHKAFIEHLDRLIA